MERALAIHSIMEQILSDVHSCGQCQHNGLDLEPSQNDISDASEELLNCILVSKSWASAAIPLLWGHHAKIEYLVYILFGKPLPADDEEEINVSASYL